MALFYLFCLKHFVFGSFNRKWNVRRTMKMNIFLFIVWKRKITLANLINRDGFSFLLFRWEFVFLVNKVFSKIVSTEPTRCSVWFCVTFKYVETEMKETIYLFIKLNGPEFPCLRKFWWCCGYKMWYIVFCSDNGCPTVLKVFRQITRTLTE